MSVRPPTFFSPREKSLLPETDLLDFSAKTQRWFWAGEHLWIFGRCLFPIFVLGTAPIFEYIRPTLMVTSTPKYPEV